MVSNATCCKSTHATNFTKTCHPCYREQALPPARTDGRCITTCGGPIGWPQLQHLQDTLDHQVSRGAWQRGAGLEIDDTWSWESPPSKCVCQSEKEARPSALRVLNERWVLIVGDSRGRFLFSALVALLSVGRPGSNAPPGWPNHRLALDGHMGCRASTVLEAYTQGRLRSGPTCKDLVRGECVEDDISARSSREGLGNSCMLDYTFGSVRVTFVWHATSMDSALQRLQRHLKGVLAAAAHAAPVHAGREANRGRPQPFPSVLLLSSGAWDMQLNWLGAPKAHTATLRAINGVFKLIDTPAAPYTHPPPAWRFAYGNWPCAHPSRSINVTGKRSERAWLGAPHFEPAGNSWPVYNWPSSYFEATRELRDTYRTNSLKHGFAWLDVEPSHRSLPAMRGSPCGNQHPFGAIAEAHVRSLLAAMTSYCQNRTTECT